MLNQETILASTSYEWPFGETHELTIQFIGSQVCAGVDGERIFEVADTALSCGSIALAVGAGRSATQTIRIEPCG